MSQVLVRNKRAGYDFELVEKYTAGLILSGTEIKSLREGNGNLTDGFCFFRANSLWIKNMHIAPYSQGGVYNHQPLRDRQLLLRKKEMGRLLAKVKEKGFTIIPVAVLMNERGYAKLEIALARGKKHHDKRESIRERDQKRELQRLRLRK